MKKAELYEMIIALEEEVRKLQLDINFLKLRQHIDPDVISITRTTPQITPEKYPKFVPYCGS